MFHYLNGMWQSKLQIYAVTSVGIVVYDVEESAFRKIGVDTWRGATIMNSDIVYTDCGGPASQCACAGTHSLPLLLQLGKSSIFVSSLVERVGYKYNPPWPGERIDVLSATNTRFGIFVMYKDSHSKRKGLAHVPFRNDDGCSRPLAIDFQPHGSMSWSRTEYEHTYMSHTLDWHTGEFACMLVDRQSRHHRARSFIYKRGFGPCGDGLYVDKRPAFGGAIASYGEVTYLVNHKTICVHDSRVGTHANMLLRWDSIIDAGRERNVRLNRIIVRPLADTVFAMARVAQYGTDQPLMQAMLYDARASSAFAGIHTETPAEYGFGACRYTF